MSLNNHGYSAVTGLLLFGGVLSLVPTAWAIPLAPPMLPGASYVDVTQAPYNAVPNDATDDTQAIQPAINAAAAPAASSSNSFHHEKSPQPL